MIARILGPNEMNLYVEERLLAGPKHHITETEIDFQLDRDGTLLFKENRVYKKCLSSLIGNTYELI